MKMDTVDILYNILLVSNFKDLKSLCIINKTTINIIKDKYFLLQKIKYDNITDIQVDNIKEYITISGSLLRIKAITILRPKKITSTHLDRHIIELRFENNEDLSIFPNPIIDEINKRNIVINDHYQILRLNIEYAYRKLYSLKMLVEPATIEYTIRSKTNIDQHEQIKLTVSDDNIINILANIICYYPNIVDECRIIK